MDFNQISQLLRNPSWDIVVFFAFIALGFFYGIAAGRRRLISFLLSIYISGFLFENFHYLERLIRGESLVSTFFARVFFFFLIVLAVSALLSSFIEGHGAPNEKNWLHSLGLSFLGAGLLFSYFFHLFPAREIFEFSPLIQKLFASDSAFFWWLTLPLVSLFLARR